MRGVGLKVRLPRVRRKLHEEPGRKTRMVRATGVRTVMKKDYLQKSIVKTRYVRNFGGKAWGVHGKYIEREGAQREGERGYGFDRTREDLDPQQTLQAWSDAKDTHCYRVIVSPENGARLDLKAHTRFLIQQMEKDLDTKLEVVAVDHHNTDNPHVHLNIRGRASDGKPLFIAKEYLRYGMRARSQEIATQTLGYRTERDALRAKARVTNLDRVTELDRALLRRAGDGREVSFQNARGEGVAYEKQRLQYLKKIGLAEKTWKGTWVLADGLEEALQQRQILSEVQSIRTHHPDLQQRFHEPLRFVKLAAKDTITGHYLGGGYLNEIGDHYAIIREPNHRLAVILKSPAIQQLIADKQLKVHDTVHLKGHAYEHSSEPLPGRAAVIAMIEHGVVQSEAKETLNEKTQGVVVAAHVQERVRTNLKTIEQHHGKPLKVEEPRPGALYEGKLVAYATGPEGKVHAVIDTGRHLRAMQTEVEIDPGTRVAARTVSDDRKQLTWRIDEAERMQQQSKERGGR